VVGGSTLWVTQQVIYGWPLFNDYFSPSEEIFMMVLTLPRGFKSPIISKDFGLSSA
jgi:hypothetical protein